ncbi:blast:Larval serum protein 1 gamma chain [Drosophila guanche]|uniref:Blast:Larval serum protein 1 gamma chain n=3 Tax=Drosophila guanche TaxID=7266 RepID=A0A3B0J9I9_DROGU|nr:blast:Larval serum protein 1 gamma chain [Drosophila guanche]
MLSCLTKTSAMKLLCLLSLSFLLYLKPVSAGGIANRYYLEKQRFLLEILHHVHEPLLNDQWRSLGEHLVSDKSQYVVYNEQMTDFFETFAHGRLVPREVYYNPQYPEHYQQSLGLYYFFYHTRDWITLWQNICWARVHVNPGMFLQALSQVLLKREDYQALVMPKIYELWPEAFHNEVTVRSARNFNFANWIRQQDTFTSQPLEVQLILPQELQPIRLEGDLRSSPKWFEAMADVHILRLKEHQRGLHRLQHLIEDIGWQSYWYYINMGIAQTENSSQELQEWWYNQLGQLLARYKLERYGQQLSYKRLTLQALTPHLLTWLNQRFQLVTPSTTKKVTQALQNLETNVADAISTRRFMLSNGSNIDLAAADNWLLGLRELFPFDLTQLQLESANEPQLLLDLRTSLRSPEFYYYAERLLRSYRRYRQVLQPTPKTSFRPTELRIDSMDITPLITYDEPVDVDLSNLLHARHFHFDGHFMWPFTLQQRQFRLQHEPFSFSLQITSNKTQSIVLRSFLTTAESGSGAVNREPFYQLDSFLTVLYEGVNRITRDSRQISGLIGDHISLTELHQYVRLAEQEEFDFPLNISTPNCGFPRRLILPRGGQGQALRLRLLIVATVYDFKARQANELNCDFSKGVSRWDELPLGYPFERYLEAEDEALHLWGDHTFWQPVEINHVDRFRHE